MIPPEIEREHILKAINEIKVQGVPPGRNSKKFKVLYKGKHYPPKYLISIANRFANRVEHPPELFGGGQETNRFLASRGFTIIDASGSGGTVAVSPRKEEKKKSHPAKTHTGRHTERCPECKVTIEKLLSKIYGDVQRECRIQVETDPLNLTGPYVDELRKIHSELVSYRGHSGFSKVNTLNVDYFVPSEKLIIEFDESQHFTKPRKIALMHYPDDLKIAFPVDMWIYRCTDLNRHDNDPLYRDEQRAWYDTIRDFYPTMNGLKPTVRLYAGDMKWCSLDPENAGDVQMFKQIISKNENQIEGSLSSWDYDKGKILDNLIRFEHLSNMVKLQYLIDCLEYDVNTEAVSGFYDISSPDDLRSQRLLRSPYGRTFALYMNKGVYKGGGVGYKYFGRLLNNCTPEQSDLIKKLDSINGEITNYIKTEKDWFPVFCEFMAIKTSVHELIVDVDDNNQKWGYSDLKELEWFLRQDRGISISGLREMVVHALRIGLNPSEPERGAPADISSLKKCDYVSFMANRDIWIEHANWVLSKAMERISRERIALVTNWQRYSLCAFDCGPIFSRKEKDYLVPKLCRSISEYGPWKDKAPVYQKMDDIVSNDVDILIGRYCDYFGSGNDTIGYFASHKEKVDVLKEFYKRLEGECSGIN